MPRRVVFVLHDLRVGGAERVMLRLAEDLVRRGAELELVTLGGGGPLEAERPDTVRHVALRAARVAWSPPRLARHLRLVRPDAIVATLPHVNTATATAAFLARSRALLVLREANDPEFEHRFAGPMGRLRARVTRWAYRRADAVVALTRGNAEAIVRHLRVPRESVHVIPNPALPVPPPASRGRPALPEGSPRLLCLARLSRQKDHATLLDAFARLARERPGAVLALLGDGPERAALESRAAALGVAERVCFAGTVIDTAPWYGWADLLVLASRWEGFPNVLLEALQQGVAIVASDCPTGPREVLDGGRFGVLVPVGDAGALAAGMARGLDAPPPAAALRARAAHYSLNEIGARWWDLLGGTA